MIAAAAALHSWLARPDCSGNQPNLCADCSGPEFLPPWPLAGDRREALSSEPPIELDLYAVAFAASKEASTGYMIVGGSPLNGPQRLSAGFSPLHLEWRPQSKCATARR